MGFGMGGEQVGRRIRRQKSRVVERLGSQIVGLSTCRKNAQLFQKRGCFMAFLF